MLTRLRQKVGVRTVASSSKVVEDVELVSILYLVDDILSRVSQTLFSSALRPFAYIARDRIRIIPILVRQAHAPSAAEVHPEGAVVLGAGFGILVVVVGEDAVAVLLEREIDELLGHEVVAGGELA